MDFTIHHSRYPLCHRATVRICRTAVRGIEADPVRQGRPTERHMPGICGIRSDGETNRHAGTAVLSTTWPRNMAAAKRISERATTATTLLLMAD